MTQLATRRALRVARKAKPVGYVAALGTFGVVADATKRTWARRSVRRGAVLLAAMVVPTWITMSASGP
jgi:hypothetical protein